MRRLRMFEDQTLLMVSGCSVPSAASVVVELVQVAKPVVGLVLVVGRSLRVAAHVEWEFEECLALLPAFGNCSESMGYC